MTGVVSTVHSAFHEGERRVQDRLGAREQADRLGSRGIRAEMPDQHRNFFAALPYVFVGTLDADGRPWASVLHGRPGFMSSPDPRTLVIEAAPSADDPARDNFASGAPIGLVGVEFPTRRRNRMNGRIVSAAGGHFAVAVDQSFGNCAQYIQAREILTARPAAADHGGGASVDAPAEALGARLDAAAAALLARADTAFVASASARADGPEPAEGVDVSHRGGRPGFLRHEALADRSRITIPDFAGNRLYNTLGNVAARPRAGLLVPDFETGGVLSLTGAASIRWDATGEDAFEGAERLLTIDVEQAHWLPDALPWRWSAPEPARQNARTGVWPAR